MPYIQEVCVAGKTIEVSKYYTARWHKKGEKRDKKEKPSSVLQEKINQRIAIRNLRRLMNANFQDGDLLVTLDYRKRERPDTSVKMQEDVTNFIKALRKRFKKAGMILKYIYVKELGPRGGAHIHIMLPECPTKWLAECWKYGGVDIKPLYSDGQYKDIAEYFVKYSDKTIETEGKLIGKRYYTSQNLVRPVPEKKVISKHNMFYKSFEKRKGYYVEPDSKMEGVTILGYEYFTYTLHAVTTERESEGG